MIKGGSSWKMLELPRRCSRAKLHIFSTISFAAIFFIVICTDTFVSNLSLHLFATKTTKRHDSPLQNDSLVQQPLTRASSMQKPNLVTKEVVVEEAYIDQDHNTLVPPFNLTIQERITWFKEKLPKFGIFKSTTLTKQFEKRVRDFLGEGCRVQFFMTWISPARSFREREFLAMDSLFKANPDSCLMILSRTMDSVHGFRILKPLLDRGFKVRAITPDLSFLFKNTPAESWLNDIKGGKQDPGEIPLAQNLSNLIRLAIMYKYGGVYLDTDFIILKDFSDLRNSIGAQSTNASGNWTRLNNAVLVFDKDHPLVYRFIEEFASTFDGNRWGYNGPYLVSRVVERETRSFEANFSVLSPMVFYPVGWTRIGSLFTRPGNRAHQRWIEAKLLQLKGETYGVHLWNKQSSRFRIEEGSIMSRLISEHCVICNHRYSSRILNIQK